MHRTLVTSFAAVASVVVFGTGSSAPFAQGQSQEHRPEFSMAVQYDRSQALRDIPSRPAVSTRPDFEVLRPNQQEAGAPDTVLQRVTAAPFPGVFAFNFDGVPADGYAPPDTVGEAGPNHYVQWVNVRFAVFDKATGQMLSGFPKAGNAVWQGFGGDCQNRNDGDPIVQYDQLADRWILTQFAVRSRNYLQCVAVSTTGDPTGSYYRYAFSYVDFPDYPKLTVWPDAYYISFNMFKNGRTFSGGRVCAYDRAKMLAGQPASQQCVQISNASLLPADLDGTSIPAGTPNFVINRGSNALNLWKFHVDFATPANSTFTGPTSIPVAGFSIACGGGACIPQKGTTTKLDSLGDRLMYRLAYRQLGSSAQRLVVNHSVTAPGNVTGIRWYEIDVTGPPSVVQQGTYAPADNLFRWMGSIAMDKFGNIAVGYSTSSSTTNPALQWAGRQVSDPFGVLSAGSTLYAGSGSQTGSLQRWGDYSTLALDPSDDCTFWFTSEYIGSNGSFNWRTHIGSFKFPACIASPAPVSTTR